MLLCFFLVTMAGSVRAVEVPASSLDCDALEVASQKLLWTTEIMEILLALVSTLLLVSVMKIRKLNKKLKAFKCD
jgi:hypothetical protein